MKKKLFYGVAAVVLVALLAAAGCSNPLDGGRQPGLSDEGRVVLRFSDLRAMSIVPEISLDTDHYEVSFTRTGFQPVVLPAISGDATQTEAVRLLPGTWQVTVSAFNGGDTMIGFAEAAVSVAARQTTTVTMAIQSLEGEGELALTADLSDLELIDPAIVGTLISGASGEVTDISMPVDGSSAAFEGDLAAGTYLLTLELAEAGTSIASYVNTVLIVFRQPTSAALVFRPVAGSVVVELLDEITRPIAITLEGLQPELGTEQSMTVTAVTATEVDTYQWYLDGEELAGEVNASIMLGAGLLEGEYLLTVVVKKGAVYSAQAEEFTVVSSLVTYTVSYDANGATSGTAPDDQTKIHGIDLELAINSGELAHTGLAFAGWNTASDGFGTDYTEGAIYGTNANLTLYAAWADDLTYMVAYDGNENTGGTVPVDPNSPYLPGATVVVLGNTSGLVRAGYTFAEWNTAEEGSGLDYDGGSLFLIVNANVTLYAQWSAKNNTVTFNANGGTGDMGPQTIATDETANLTANTFTREGYSFTGWNTESDGSGDSYSDQAWFRMGTESVTLYAQWALCLWTVTDSNLIDPDGNTYDTIQLGNQIWTVSNLRTTKYNDGTDIRFAPNQLYWHDWPFHRIRPMYCYPNYTEDPDEQAKWGALYNKYTVETKKLAPARAGWRVPTEADWMALIEYLATNGYNWDETPNQAGNSIAKAMAANTDWVSSSQFGGDAKVGTPGNDLSSNNSTGFSALPAGYVRGEDARFFHSGLFGQWWSSSHFYYFELYYNYIYARIKGAVKESGFSVRLVRDVD